jgi:hypothetical protein
MASHDAKMYFTWLNGNGGFPLQFQMATGIKQHTIWKPDGFASEWSFHFWIRK